jgi:ubiquinone/menaquinone biosynthesis C-methylase UbiE
MMDHSIYDKRNYPIVDAQRGYTEWSRTYEQVVEDAMDLRLFERLQTVEWAAARHILDLACGTGRIGMWMKGRTSAPIDGVDFTPAMLDKAHDKGIYRALQVADVTQTGLPGGNYDLITQSLADEHLPDLKLLYREVVRLLTTGGVFAIVGFHPQFLMGGVPTHYNRESGEPTTIRSYVHLLSDHVKAARAAALTLLEMDEGLVDADWLKVKPKWEKYLGQPISFSMVWRKN